jgi:hypothetical protein
MDIERVGRGVHEVGKEEPMVVLHDLRVGGGSSGLSIWGAAIGGTGCWRREARCGRARDLVRRRVRR